MRSSKRPDDHFPDRRNVFQIDYETDRRIPPANRPLVEPKLLILPLKKQTVRQICRVVLFSRQMVIRLGGEFDRFPSR